MKRAANKYRDNTTLESTKKRAKLDGAWQKHGHASLNRCVSTVVSNKCLNVEALSKFCSGCKMWGKRKAHQNI